jgi:starvation-inducible outer membrane lipoprotein
MSARWIVSACLFALVLAGCASSAKEISKGDASRVRVVKDTSLVSGCQVLGTVADNEFEDLQKKAARLGGNVALLTPERAAKGGYFGLQDYMTADVYRCENAR